MVVVLNKTTRIIYWILIFLAFATGLLFYTGDKELKFLILFSGLPFFLFVTGLFGLLWPRIKPAGESTYIIHAIIMGILFLILFLIHTWILLPLFCPDFEPCCGFEMPV